MKKLLFIISVLSIIGCNSNAKTSNNALSTPPNKSITGTWEGTLTVQATSLRIVFHLSWKDERGYSCKMDSPDQGVNGISCDTVMLHKDSVIINIKSINGGYKGMFVNDSTINGNWEQGGMKFPLVLKKGSGIKESPKALTNVDSNCIETAIVLETKTGKIYGTLCTPKAFKKGPVALIIAGSGPTDRDGNNSMGLTTDAYKILAHKLAANHIATVRYDKRGIAESHDAMKSESDLRFEDYVNDATDWLTMLKTDKRFTMFIVVGHSEGSLIGIIAAKNGGADKYISIAGIGESADKTLKRQLASQPKSFQDNAFPIIDSLVAGKTVKNISKDCYTLFHPGIQPYLISWFKYNPSVEIGKLSIPVLILQGKNDIQVTVEDAEKLKAGNKKAKMLIMEDMNHVLRDVKGDRDANLATYNNPSLPLDAELVARISAFITGPGAFVDK